MYAESKYTPSSAAEARTRILYDSEEPLTVRDKNVQRPASALIDDPERVVSTNVVEEETTSTLIVSVESKVSPVGINMAIVAFRN
jgi:hypothetical protein